MPIIESTHVDNTNLTNRAVAAITRSTVTAAMDALGDLPERDRHHEHLDRAAEALETARLNLNMYLVRTSFDEAEGKTL